MSSDQKPETWGYGLTWFVIVALVGMVGFGTVKLYATAKHSTHELEVQKLEAEVLGKAALIAQAEATELKIAAAEKAEADAIAKVTAADPLARGKTIYMNCLVCHGDKAQGVVALKAPALAGQADWYLKTSINKFRKDIRGGDSAKDPQGFLMAVSIKQFVKTDVDVDAVIAYIKSIQPIKVAHTMEGDAAKGQASYMMCLACHGDKAQGNIAMKAPALATLPDWYIVEQLKKFKSGIRGAHPEDLEAKTMLPFMAMVADEEAMKNIAAYIKTLKK